MTLVVFGAAGQVGRELCRLAVERGVACRGWPRAEVDITDAGAVAAAVAGAGLVVNCAAYTAVDRAESEAALAFAVNRDGAGNIAEACARRGVPLVHFSTDYVFDGSKPGPWREDDAPNPINAYGASKLAGERAVAESGAAAIVLRTGWVFAAQGQNFVRTMLRLAAERDELAVVDDQRGGPTAAADLAAAILAIRERIVAPGFDCWGIYHYGGAPPTTWYGFARTILAGRERPRLRPIPSTEFPTAARRPANSVLDCRRIGEAFGLAPPDWHAALARVLAALS